MVVMRSALGRIGGHQAAAWLVLAAAPCWAFAQVSAGREKTSARPATIAGPSYLGVGVQDLTASRAQQLGLAGDRGVELTLVEEDGPAAKAGLKISDVVLEYNGQPVEGTRQFVGMVHQTLPGRKAKLTISRDGKPQTVTVTLGERPSVEARAGGGPGDQPHPTPMFMVPNFPPGEMPGWLPGSGMGLLGVQVETLNSQLAEYFGVRAGVLVRMVLRDSAAERAGMKAGDVIQAVDGISVANTGELLNAEATARAGESCQLEVMRNKRPIKLTVLFRSNGDGERATPVRLPNP